MTTDEVQQTEATKRKRGWRKLFQFRLRVLLVVVLLFAAAFAWLRMTANEAARQIKVVEDLEKSGATLKERISIEELKASGEWKTLTAWDQAWVKEQGFLDDLLAEPNGVLAFLDTGYLDRVSSVLVSDPSKAENRSDLTRLLRECENLKKIVVHEYFRNEKERSKELELAFPDCEVTYLSNR